jgi:hypothetical protein
MSTLFLCTVIKVLVLDHRELQSRPLSKRGRMGRAIAPSVKKIVDLKFLNILWRV